MTLLVRHAVIATALMASPALAQAPTIENERVSVWELALSPGRNPAPATGGRDVVVMFLDAGSVGSASRRAGDAVFVPRDQPADLRVTSSAPVRAVLIALKDVVVPPLPRPPGLPPGFPRPGAEKVLENDRVIVWTYSWSLGAPTAMHFHDKDVVIAYRFNGAIESVGPDGAKTVSAFKSGQIRFAPRDRTHFERLVEGRQAAVLTELK